MSKYKLSNSTPFGFGNVQSTGTVTPFTSLGLKIDSLPKRGENVDQRTTVLMSHLNKVSSILPIRGVVPSLSDIWNSTFAFTLICLAEPVENGDKTIKMAEFGDAVFLNFVANAGDMIKRPGLRKRTRLISGIHSTTNDAFEYHEEKDKEYRLAEEKQRNRAKNLLQKAINWLENSNFEFCLYKK
uniref:Uncharacterized protein n=1 Tax=Romanomermis culicivorax TaxID=13658 RepID=A0A915IYJ1_ROMCU